MKSGPSKQVPGQPIKKRASIIKLGNEPLKKTSSSTRFANADVVPDENTAHKLFRSESMTRMSEQTPKNQYKIAGSLYIGQLLVGYVLGWTAPVIPKLKDIEATPFKYALSDSQASWLGSSLYFGCTSGPYLSGYLCNKIGRKPCLFIGGTICLMGFTAMAFSKELIFMYFGRILTGVSNGMLFVTNLVYLGEMASPNIRGMLLTLTGVFTTLGTLLIYTVGPFVPYELTCWLAVLTATTYLVLVIVIVPESPVYQVMKGYRGEAVLNLIALGRRDDYLSIEDAASEEHKTNMEQLKEMFTYKANKRALFIIIILNISQQASGFIAVIFFVTTIFDLTGLSLPSYIATIIVGITQVLAACLTPLFVDITGRKSLLLFSTAGCSISLATLGTYFYLHNTKDPIVSSLGWLSLSSLILFFIFFNIGFGIIPNTYVGEMFTTNVRSFGSSFTVSIGWIFGFGIATAFGYMVPAFGAHSTFWMYSGSCAFAFFFTIFFVPETKGKTLFEIQQMLSK
ncbi:hypothetical protein PYW07_010180 [Mythimna separata]|uniref:Major facilitator superfamily (MFS) profile domain-containing protein n=1 Tax=Mythimna separata TaxID=271217 RepID=A0AAD8DRG7_MYTSE|nr:hypothetical protein PYW07_010180 [Mythimna separata]